MGASTPFYDKYGGFSSPDFRSMVSGQAAVDSSISGVFTGVKDLLKQTEDIYKENNTLNMQSYLQNKLKNEGLGAEPLDTVAIKQQFGNMINMEKLGETFATEKQQMEMHAVDQAAKVASEIEDPLQSRQLFTQTLRDMGAGETLTSKATQNFADSNALRFQDYELEQTKQRNERTTNFFAEIENKGEDAAEQAIVMLTKDLPEDQREGEKRRLLDELEQRSQLTAAQRENMDNYINMEKTVGDRRILSAKSKLEQLEIFEATLQKTGVSEEHYKLADGIVASGLGNSVPAAIGNEVNNWAERLWPGKNDSDRVKAMYDRMIAAKVEAKDAGAILALAFNEAYPGKRFLGNDLSSEGLAQMDARVEELGQNMLDRYAVTGEITKAREEVSSTELSVQENLLKLRKSLTDAGRNTRLRVKGALNMDDTYTMDFGNGTPTAVRPTPPAKPLPANIKNTFARAEKQYQLPSGYLARTAALESSNDPGARNSKSSAKGLFQMLDSTAQQYGLNDPFDPMASTDAAARLAMDNQKILTKALGRKPTAAELYLAHQQGGEGAAALLADPDARAVDAVGAKQVALNDGRRDMTSGEFASKWISKFNAGTGAGSSPGTIDTAGTEESSILTSDATEKRAQEIAARRAAGNATPATTPSAAPGKNTLPAVDATLPGKSGSPSAKAVERFKDNTSGIAQIRKFFGGVKQDYNEGQERSKKLASEVPSRSEQLSRLKKMSAKEQKNYLNRLSITFGKTYANRLMRELQ